MRERPAARLLVLDAEKRVLLFHFAPRSGPLAGQAFWATPGGAVDPGESYEDAARRELREETGLSLADPGPQVARREAVFRVFDGDMVRSDERYFLIQVEALEVSDAQWTELEREVMAAHRWWTPDDLAATPDQVWPEDLADMLRQCGAW